MACSLTVPLGGYWVDRKHSNGIKKEKKQQTKITMKKNREICQKKTFPFLIYMLNPAHRQCPPHILHQAPLPNQLLHSLRNLRLLLLNPRQLLTETLAGLFTGLRGMGCMGCLGVPPVTSITPTTSSSRERRKRRRGW